MCAICGCSDNKSVTITDARTGEQVAMEHEHVDAQGRVQRHVHGPGDQHSHDHDPGHHHHGDGQAHTHAHSHAHGDHDHDHDHHHEEALHARAHGQTMALEQAILGKNRLIAERNRSWLAGREILALNLVSSPGSGKTTLLERTIRDVGADLRISVIEGDQATLNDAERIRATGAPAIQINTGAGCHLEADMLARGLEQLQPPAHSVVMIENVGNLVCPALFDLGERAKVVILSVTEGEDKPAKYPHMFRAAELMLLNKIDLLPHLRFDVARCIACAREVNPAIRVLQVSAQTGEGMAAWYGWLKAQMPERVATRPGGETA